MLSKAEHLVWDELQFDAGYPNVTGFLSVADL